MNLSILKTIDEEIKKFKLGKFISIINAMCIYVPTNKGSKAVNAIRPDLSLKSFQVDLTFKKIIYSGVE